MDRSIRTSAKALVIRDGRLLAVTVRDSDGTFYILPGGGLDPEELLPECVCREVAEETGLRIACGELLFAIEGMRGEAFHRVDLVFACQYIGEIPNALRHGDTNQIGFAWLDIRTLNAQPLYPSKLRRPIMNYYQGRPYQTYLGNESVGDPECAD